MKNKLCSISDCSRIKSVNNAKGGDWCFIFAVLFLVFSINLSGSEKTLPKIGDQLKTPLYTMPSVIQAYCPNSFRIPLGILMNKQIQWWEGPGISVTDLVADPSRKIKEIKFKCVTTETVLGIIGISLLTNN